MVGVANGVMLIDPERDGDNLPTNKSLPPMLPKEFSSMMPSSFVAVVIRFCSRLEKNFDQNYIVGLEEEQCSLRDLYTRDETFKTMIG